MELRLFASVKTAQVCEQIVQQIEQAICAGALSPGQRLPSERALAKQFGVSRMTLRRAMHLLEGKGLVETRSGSGTFVSHPGGKLISPVVAGDISRREGTRMGHGR